jgi:nitrate/TMAO reductase-like tetraheme cytochrome c subunit
MKSPVPTALAADLRSLALDPGALPPIEKLDPKALRGVMKLIAKSLGARCGDCHLEGDFAAPTARKRVAAKMWDEFVAKLALTDGTPLFCDSCHQGRTKQLNRGDMKALSTWMDDNFVARLKRKDEKEHGCETCHVDMEMRFLNKWAGPP